MPTKTQKAKEHTPVGDPSHVAYGKDYYWSCTCKLSASTFTTESKAEYRAKQHETYCPGTTTVKVNA